VRIARELLERAETEGVSLVGPGGLLAGYQAVLQSAPGAEMADHLSYDKGNGRLCRLVTTGTAPCPRRRWPRPARFAGGAPRPQRQVRAQCLITPAGSRGQRGDLSRPGRMPAWQAFSCSHPGPWPPGRADRLATLPTTSSVQLPGTAVASACRSRAVRTAGIAAMSIGTPHIGTIESSTPTISSGVAPPARARWV
jgi:hypothetical protein